MDELEEQINNAKQLNHGLKFRGCLVTMFYNRDVCRQGEEYLQGQRYPVFKTHIRRTEKADEVTFTNMSLMEYSPRSGAARDYKAFVKEYLEG
jgi:chromosome partitioning protein